MTGYRDTSGSYEPFGTNGGGRPLRPYNWVQWTGVGCALLGIAIDLVYFAGRLGYVRAPWATPTLALPPIFLGIVLVNSRREPVHDIAPELAAQRKRWLLIVSVISVVIIGAAIIIDFLGAGTR